MQKRILITGGAGFLGSHLADALLAYGYQVRVLDVLSPQVHGMKEERPTYLHPEVEFVCEDICHADAVRQALRGVSAVFHLAAAVGVGQSMYELEKYLGINTLGTAVLLEALMEHPVERLIVASSMSIYGEGLYRAADSSLYTQAERSLTQLRAGLWEVCDPQGNMLEPLPTPESKPPALASIYALSKYNQERMCLMIGRAYNIPTVALRFFNIFGPPQALSNPYTGVLAIFASRYLNNQPPIIFEDGLQQRDFVSVYDVVQACRLALEVPQAAGHVFNIGSGCASTISEVAALMAQVLGTIYLAPCITQTYRMGDIRHCFADITRAQTVLGYTPRVTLAEGLAEMVEWLAGQIANDYSAQASAELRKRGLVVSTTSV
jgi:dTDP-L-rhamnose 4-epimerase